MSQAKLSTRKVVTVAIVTVFFLFQMYLALIKQLPPLQQSPIHLILALLLVYLFKPVNEKCPEKKWLLIIDALAFAGIAFMLYYVMSNSARLIQFVMFIDPVKPIDIAFMIVTSLVLLEAVRRTLGSSTQFRTDC